jgi:hypothetical protein
MYIYLSFAIYIILRESGLKFETEKKSVAYLQEDFLFTTDTRLCKILKKCLFEQFFQIPEILCKSLKNQSFASEPDGIFLDF